MPSHQDKVASLAASIYDRLRSRGTRKAVNFDLETEAVLKETGLKSTGPAYTAIREYLEAHGFRHRQYSGYVSREPMSMRQVKEVKRGMEDALPWITGCYERCDATAILGPTFDLLAVDETRRSGLSDDPSMASLAEQAAGDFNHESVADIDLDDFTPEEQSITLDAIAELYRSCCDAFNRPNDGRCPGADRGDDR